MDRDIRILLDEREIGALINKYCRTMDLVLKEEWLACFTADAVFEVLLPNGATYVSLKGEGDLRRFFAGFEGRTGVHKHVYVTPIIEVDPDAGSAVATSDFLMLSGEGTKVGVSSFGRTTDRFVRTGAGWRISERRLVTEAMNVPTAVEPAS